jgi:hypothetical protein
MEKLKNICLYIKHIFFYFLCMNKVNRYSDEKREYVYQYYSESESYSDTDSDYEYF